MWRFILEVIVFSLISMLCFSVFGQNWQDEEHVWDEERQEWVVQNRAQGRIAEDGPVGGFLANEARPYYGQPWERYLSKNVKYGRRDATPWELSEAKRKLWAKEMMVYRSMERAQERRRIMAYRKSTGWYAARRSGGYNPAYNGMLMMHMQSVNNYVNGGRYGGGY